MPGHHIINRDLMIWNDHMPNLGLDLVAHMDLDQKRQWLFGRNTIDDEIRHVPLESAVLFDHYLNISLFSNRQTIFFPWYFLHTCVDYADLIIPDHLPIKQTSLVCLMNKERYARILASCWFANHEKEIIFCYTQRWEECPDVLYELLQIGGLKDWTGEWGPNLKNLKSNFIPEYLNSRTPLNNGMSWHYHITRQISETLLMPSASAVVLEPVFWEHGCMITEKYLQAVLGGCIPIVNGHKIYNYLESIGFETFGDIIDQSSQHEKNPVLATWNLMDKNLVFFQNALDLYHDTSVRERLLYNINHVKNHRSLYQNMLKNLNSDLGIELFNRYKKEIFHSQYSGRKITDVFYDIKI